VAHDSGAALPALLLEPVRRTGGRSAGRHWDSTIEADLTYAGVGTVVIPRTGKASKARAAIEHADTFITAAKWHTGCEGRISHLKRDWAWRRTRPS
jgi:hypothetical protein